MQRLLGLKKQVTYSFIAQCFAVKGSWVDSMLHSIDFNQASGFSEFELLGNYAARFHGDEMALATTKWNRRGNRLIGGI